MELRTYAPFEPALSIMSLGTPLTHEPRWHPGGREDEAYGSLPAVVADLAVVPDTRYGTCRVAACGPAGFLVVEAAEGWGDDNRAFRGTRQAR